MWYKWDSAVTGLFRPVYLTFLSALRLIRVVVFLFVVEFVYPSPVEELSPVWGILNEGLFNLLFKSETVDSARRHYQYIGAKSVTRGFVLGNCSARSPYSLCVLYKVGQCPCSVLLIDLWSYRVK